MKKASFCTIAGGGRFHRNQQRHDITGFSAFWRAPKPCTCSVDNFVDIVDKHMVSYTFICG